MRYWCKRHFAWAHAYWHDNFGGVEYACYSGILYPVLSRCELAAPQSPGDTLPWFEDWNSEEDAIYDQDEA